MLITLSILILTAILLGIIFLFVGNNKGTIVLLVGLICLFVLFFIMLVGLVKGDLKFLKLNDRFNISLVITYLAVTAMLLSVMWLYNFSLHARLGDLTASSKMNFIQGKQVISENLQKLTEDYAVLEHDHITFRYHPDNEKQVYEIIDKIESLTELEIRIFGREINKTDKLEVIALLNSKEYIQLNPLSTETVGGSYDSSNKRATVYRDRESFDDDWSFMIGTFAHEYSHYLIDLFLTEEGINDNDIPAWYKEGISELFRYQTVDTISIPENIDTDLKYTDLHDQRDWSNASEKDVYFLAEKAIEYIVGHHGGEMVLSKILLHQKETGSFEESFDQITGLELATLNTRIYSVEKDLAKAYKAWQESDFETAEKLYEEITKAHPSESLAWHQYAMMLEKQMRWDDALGARRQVNSIDPKNAQGFQNTSYLLTVIDTKEAVATAKVALELAEMDSIENTEFYKKWLDVISQYHNLINEERYTEAYKVISQSEQFSNMPVLLEYLKDKRK